MASGNTTASSDKQIRAGRTQHRFGYLVFGDEIVDVTTFTNIPASYKGLPHVPEFDENSLYSNNLLFDAFQRDMSINML